MLDPASRRPTQPHLHRRAPAFPTVPACRRIALNVLLPPPAQGSKFVTGTDAHVVKVFNYPSGEPRLPGAGPAPSAPPPPKQPAPHPLTPPSSPHPLHSFHPALSTRSTPSSHTQHPLPQMLLPRPLTCMPPPLFPRRLSVADPHAPTPPLSQLTASPSPTLTGDSPRLLTRMQSAVRHVALDPKGKLVAVGADDGAIRMMQLSASQFITVRP